MTGYIGKITRSLALNRYEKYTAQKRGSGEVPVALDELAECISGGSDPVAEVEAKELAKAVGRFLDTVPYKERKVFLMRYFALAKIQDIADQCDMHPGKVKSMLHRTRGKLRIALQKEGY